uniref:Putative cysteine/serine-rich nuclear protein n-terminus n=1 Tax=Xenopsylla cheopis TaxID=163159 RepID=A0A6M2DFD6_XENCH
MEMGQNQHKALNNNVEDNGESKSVVDNRKRKQPTRLGIQELGQSQPPTKLFKNENLNKNTSPCKVEIQNKDPAPSEINRPYIFNRPIMNDYDDDNNTFGNEVLISPCKVRIARMDLESDRDSGVNTQRPENNKDLITFMVDSENSSLRSEEGSDSGLGSDALGTASYSSKGNDKKKHQKSRVRFHAVTVHYFPRAQGFCCVPSQGGSTLGMSFRHVSTRRLSVARHCAERRHRLESSASSQMSKNHNSRSNLFIENEISSDQEDFEESEEDSCEEDSDSDEEDSEFDDDDTLVNDLEYNDKKDCLPLRTRSVDAKSDLINNTTSTASNIEQVKECLETNTPIKDNTSQEEKNSDNEQSVINNTTPEDDVLTEDDEEQDLSCGSTTVVLAPVPARKRRALLHAAGVKKIDPKERDECRAVRASREVCGCDCRGFCDPETCACSRAGVKCQVDRVGFPCGCHKDGCANTAGRAEFNPHRVRTHFMHTLMRLALEERHLGLTTRGSTTNTNQSQHRSHHEQNSIEKIQESFRNPIINHGYPNLFYSYGEQYGYESYMYSTYDEPAPSAGHAVYPNLMCHSEQNVLPNDLRPQINDLRTQSEHTQDENGNSDTNLEREENFAEIIKNTMVDTVSV